MENWQQIFPEAAAPVWRKRWVQWAVYTLAFGLLMAMWNLPWEHSPSVMVRRAPAPWLNREVFQNPLIGTFLGYLGGWWLLRFVQVAVKDLFWSMGLTMLVLGSPVWASAYAGGDFAVVGAAAFAWLGFLWYFRMYQTGRWQDFAWSQLAWGIAGLLDFQLDFLCTVSWLALALERGIGLRVRPGGVLHPQAGWKYLLGVGAGAIVPLLLAPFYISSYLAVSQEDGWGKLLVREGLASWSVPGWVVLVALAFGAYVARKHLDRGLLRLLVLCAAGLAVNWILISDVGPLPGFRAEVWVLVPLVLVVALKAVAWEFSSLFVPHRWHPGKLFLLVVAVLGALWSGAYL